MPNQLQVAFLASFVGVFSFLLLVSSVLRTKLEDVLGYDISELILIGLPRDPDNASRRASHPFNTRTGMFAQLLALALAIGTSVVIYWKFASNKRQSLLLIE